MKKAEVYKYDIRAGILIEDDSNYTFIYDDSYYLDNSKPSISLTMPKSQKEYKSKFLFPAFSNLLSEGVNRKLQSRTLKIDEKDSFGLLLATANYDTVGALTVKPID
jgi:HipA-like protein